MPLILRGSQLLLNESGNLASTHDCCCGVDEDCFCPDLCQYQIQITSPSTAMLPPLPARPCGLPDTPQLWPVELPDACSCGGDFFFLQSQAKVAGKLSVDYQFGFGAQLEFYGLGVDQENTSFFSSYFLSEIQVSLTCLHLPDGPQVAAYITWTGGMSTGLSQRIVQKAGVYELQSLCQTQPQTYTCSRSSAFKSTQITTPLTITVSQDTTSLGAWKTVQADVAIGDLDQVQQCFDECVASIAATFVITKRPTPCRNLDCSCLASLSGLVFTFEGKTFDIREGAQTITEFYDNGIREWTYGIGGGQYVFEYRDLLAGLYEVTRRKVSLYCETDTEAVPEVDRWYALFETKCMTVDLETTDALSETLTQEIGYFLCFDAQGCDTPAAGVRVPLGDAVDIEVLPGFPQQTPGLPQTCNATPRASFSISENGC